MSLFKQLTKMLGINKEPSKPTVMIAPSKHEWVVLATNNTAADTVVIDHSVDKLMAEFEEISIPTGESPIEIGHDCELLAKHEAYKLGVSVETNTDTAMAAKGRLAAQGYSLEPLGTDDLRDQGLYLNALVKDENPAAPITILCRGTKGDASIFADLDPSSPGSSVLNKHRDSILAQLDTLCKKYPGRKIRLTGHSLGGALSQLLTDHILAIKAKSSETEGEYKYLASISGIETVVFQSAGVAKEVVARVTENARKIKAKNKAFKINFITHVKDGDFVSRTGAHIFADVEPDLADVTLIQAKLDKPCVTLGDAVDVGFAAVTSFNPVWLGVKSMLALANRYVSNRVEAHKDYFYHDRDTKAETTLAAGVYSNHNPEDRATIHSVLSEDIVSVIPYANEIQQFMFRLTNGLNNDEVKAAIAVAGVTPATVNAAVDLVAASRSPSKLLAAAARHIADFQKLAKLFSPKSTPNSAVREEHGFANSQAAHVANGCLKMYNNLRQQNGNVVVVNEGKETELLQDKANQDYGLMRARLA